MSHPPNSERRSTDTSGVSSKKAWPPSVLGIDVMKGDTARPPTSGTARASGPRAPG